MKAQATSGRGAVGDFQRQRKRDSRQQLLAAASNAFCEVGYTAVSVDEIASAAGVSRMTFYRHFTSKAAIAADLFRENFEAAMPSILAIGEQNYLDREVVRHWIERLFAADRSNGALLRVFVQANAAEPGFTERAHRYIALLISSLGRAIPAFDVNPDDAADRRRWIEAWLIVYEILDQGNHASREAGVAIDPLVPEILADRFVEFARRVEPLVSPL